MSQVYGFSWPLARPTTQFDRAYYNHILLRFCFCSEPFLMKVRPVVFNRLVSLLQGRGSATIGAGSPSDLPLTFTVPCMDGLCERQPHLCHRNMETEVAATAARFEPDCVNIPSFCHFFRWVASVFGLVGFLDWLIHLLDVVLLPTATVWTSLGIWQTESWDLTVNDNFISVSTLSQNLAQNPTQCEWVCMPVWRVSYPHGTSFSYLKKDFCWFCDPDGVFA